ncbi:protein ecdysoneless isoform X2 [Sipha flava]|uniref:Protein ecdysoneless isoform X2 n=1 Tax=Sipha flava TaxID=143950 RepID=A0A8B8FHG3_9HEMI|nr:protein ecdysoneless isoform X2 [Sipha flava]
MDSVLETVRDDDFVEYFLFVRPGDGNEDAEELVKNINQLNTKVLELVDRLSNGYIWHKDQFNLIPRFCPSVELRQSFSDTSNEILPTHLYGVTHFGDNIEDEWFIVYLLKEISKEYQELIIRVIDSDGEFLLIEAAECLPNWADPVNCHQRVYINDGDIHIIPLTSINSKKSITISQALEQIIKYPTATIATEEVNDAISSRLHGYPEKIKENLHRCHAYIPVDIAYLLKHQPSLIAPAVLAFCHRDPLDVRACRVMKNFPLKERVMRMVTMTKCLYAMLVQQKFIPERKTGWNLVESSDPQYQAQIIGIKIACGFEILVSQAKSAVNNTPIDLTYDKRWHQYKSSLTDKGYFKNLYEGSNGYKLLEDQAKQYYLSNVDEYLSSPSISQRIKIILDGITKDEIAQLKSDTTVLEPADDEKWLNVTPSDLDRILEQKFGLKNSEQTSASNLASTFTDKIRSFLNQASDINGAEFSKNHLSDDDDDDDDDDDGDENAAKPLNEKLSELLVCGPEVMCPTNDDKDAVSTRYKKKKSKSIEKNNINFEPEKYEAALRSILDFKIPEDDWNESNSSDMDSYGSDCDDILSDRGSSISKYMNQMDKELASTSLGSSFVKKETNSKNKPKKTVRINSNVQFDESEEDNFSDVEDFEPVDIDVNAFQNILKSYQEQLGLPGPAGNLLGPAGLNLGQEPSK